MARFVGPGTLFINGLFFKRKVGFEAEHISHAPSKPDLRRAKSRIDSFMRYSISQS